MPINSAIGFFDALPKDRYRDFFGVMWDRTVDSEVRRESRRLLDLGREGGYIFAPSHAVESDVPLANILAFIEEAHKQ